MAETRATRGAVSRVELAVYALALIARLGWAIFDDAKPISDASWYHQTAQLIATGQGYTVNGHPTAYWPVGYSAVLGGVYALFGASPLAGRLLNALLSWGALVFASRLARALYSPRVGIATAVMVAAYPADIVYCATLLSEPLFLFSMMAGCWAVLRYPNRRGLVAGGLLFGLAALTRNQGIALPFLVVGAAALETPERWRSHLRRLALLVGVCLLVVAPWTLRNWVELHRFVLVSTNGGINSYMGNNPRATGRYQFDAGVRSALLGTRKDWRGGPSEVEVDRRAYALSERYVFEHPAKALALWPAKMVALYDRDDHSLVYAREPSRASAKRWVAAAARPADWFYQALATLGLVGLVSLLLSAPSRSRWIACSLGALLAFWILGVWAGCLFLLFAAGLARYGPPTREPEPRSLLPVVFVVTLSAAHFAFFGAARFHAPMMPWLAIAAAVLVADLMPAHVRPHPRVPARDHS